MRLPPPTLGVPPQAAPSADHIVVHYDPQLYGNTLQTRQQALTAALGGAGDVRQYQVRNLMCQMHASKAG